MNTSQAGGYSGFGVAQNEVQDLSKALEAGYQVGSGKTGGSALRVESLDAALKVTTYTSSHIKFWKKIPKTPAYSTVEEYNETSSYGGSGGAFLGEGETPQSTDASVIRRMKQVKYLGTLREVTHPAMVVHPAHGDLVAFQAQTGILWLLNTVETNLFTGDSSLAFAGEAKQWDGLDNLIDPTSVIDLEGNSMQEADVEEATNTILENYGFADNIFSAPRVMSDFVKTLYPRQRVEMPAPVNGRVGMSVSSFGTQAGEIESNPNVFIRKQPVPPSAATSANAPASPASIADGATTGTTGDHTKGSPAGTTYFNYVVTACNHFGESAPTAVQGGTVDITQANKVTGHYVPLTITNPGTIGAFPPEYFRIYRSVASTTNTVPAAMSSYSLVMQVPTSSQTASGTTVVNDVNLQLPFTYTAYVGEMTPSVLSFRQLYPLMKMDLAVTGPSLRFLMLLYGVPLMFATKKWLRLINIGEMAR